MSVPILVLEGAVLMQELELFGLRVARSRLIQICQNWLPGFWSLTRMLMRLKTHEDQFSPIKILTISEWQEEKHMGAGLGEVFQQQMSKLWSIVARGNTETLPTMQMTAVARRPMASPPSSRPPCSPPPSIPRVDLDRSIALACQPRSQPHDGKVDSGVHTSPTSRAGSSFRPLE